MSNFLTAGAWSTTYFYWLRNCMFWISSGKDLALWMNLLRWPILSAIAVNPEPGSRWNCTRASIHLSTACDTLRRRPSQKVIKPDFLFPSAGAYHDTEFPVENLRMLAVKTTCKDRWRQILNEADKIHQVHLFTPVRESFLAQYRRCGSRVSDWSCHHLCTKNTRRR